MSNDYFRFKLFTVWQKNTAMKVCTDACLFGSWVADKLSNNELQPANILDIGTGTGLFSLMLAQKSSATIDAIEIEASAAEQAKENFAGSPFKERLRIIHGDVRKFETTKRYELIISNPPFYAQDLKSATPEKNVALHSQALNFNELLKVVARLLTDKGAFAVLLPHQRAQEFIQTAAAYGLSLHEQCMVKQTEKHSYFRSMCLLKKQSAQAATSAITISENGAYSPQVIQLLKDYYLKL